MKNAVLSARNSLVKNGDSPNTTTCPLTTHLSYQQAADLILYYKKLAEEAQK